MKASTSLLPTVYEKLITSLFSEETEDWLKNSEIDEIKFGLKKCNGRTTELVNKLIYEREALLWENMSLINSLVQNY